MVLSGASIYCTWRTIFITKCKSDKLWKYINGLAIIPGPDSQYFSTIATIETKSTSFFVNISEVEEWLDKKEVYELGFKQAKNKYFISVDKSHLVTILELSISKKMFQALNKKYSATNPACLHQLL